MLLLHLGILLELREEGKVVVDRLDTYGAFEESNFALCV
jgi:hypothetical protein